jgi:hypothetical protein
VLICAIPIRSFRTKWSQMQNIAGVEVTAIAAPTTRRPDDNVPAEGNRLQPLGAGTPPFRTKAPRPAGFLLPGTAVPAKAQAEDNVTSDAAGRLRPIPRIK